MYSFHIKRYFTIVCTLHIYFLFKLLFQWMISVRVSNELGAGYPKSVAFSVVMLVVVSFRIPVSTAIIALCLHDVLSYVFSPGEAVARVVSDLTHFFLSSFFSMESSQSC